MGSDKPLPTASTKPSKTTGKRKEPHNEGSPPASGSSSEDTEESSSENDDGAGRCSDTSSVNTETSETSLTAFRPREQPSSSNDVK